MKTRFLNALLLTALCLGFAGSVAAQSVPGCGTWGGQFPVPGIDPNSSTGFPGMPSQMTGYTTADGPLCGLYYTRVMVQQKRISPNPTTGPIKIDPVPILGGSALAASTYTLLVNTGSQCLSATHTWEFRNIPSPDNPYPGDVETESAAQCVNATNDGGTGNANYGIFAFW